MDEEARKERLELMMARKIVLEERQEVVRINIEVRKRAFLERCAAERKLRRAEMKEMHRLRQENMDMARKIRRAKIQEHNERFERFCARAAEFIRHEREYLKKEEPQEQVVQFVSARESVDNEVKQTEC